MIDGVIMESFLASAQRVYIPTFKFSFLPSPDLLTCICTYIFIQVMPKERTTRFANQQQPNNHNPLAPLPPDGSHKTLESAIKDAQLAFLAPDALRSIRLHRSLYLKKTHQVARLAS